MLVLSSSPGKRKFYNASGLSEVPPNHAEVLPDTLNPIGPTFSGHLSCLGLFSKHDLASFLKPMAQFLKGPKKHPG